MSCAVRFSCCARALVCVADDVRAAAEEDMFDAVAALMGHRLRDVHQAAAEVCGLLLGSLRRRGSSSEELCVTVLGRHILLLHSRRQYDRMLSCLEMIALEPDSRSFVDPFFNRIFEVLPTLVSDFKVRAAASAAVMARPLTWRRRSWRSS